MSDWSRKGPLPDIPQRRVSDRPGYGSRGFDAASDAGSERGGRRPYEPADGKIRDFSSWERKGPLPPTAAPVPREGGRPRSREAPQFRRASPAWGEGRSQDGSRPPRREFTERALERTPTAPELDNQWRARMRPDPPAQPSAPVSDATPAAAPAASPVQAAPALATRPKLNLQKRTVPDHDITSPTTGDSKSSPFGAARPIDTAARERQVEEKRLQKKKEAEEKAKAEAEEKQKLAQEQELAKQKEKEDAAKSAANTAPEATNGSKEGTSAPTSGEKDVEILQRKDVPENADAPSASAEAPVAPSESKAPTAKENDRPQPPSRANSNWRPSGPRRGSGHGQQAPRNRGSPKAAPQPPTPTVDEDGWSTVSAKPRGGRRGGYRAA